MSDGTSLINFGDLTKPATVLIEKIADATGVLYEPQRIRKRAKAEAEADLIKAEAQIEITALQRRALTRFVQEEGKKQENIEDITEEAIPLLNENSSPENIEDDWIANFFDKCRIVSDKEMQTLWSKILAGEANSPNSFSKKTVNLLASLDKSDAELFTILCGFGFFLSEVQPIVYDVNDDIYNKLGINFVTLKHLNYIGLISFENVGGYQIQGNFKANEIHYYGDSLILEFETEKHNSFKVGTVMLTQAGQQFAKICGSRPVEGFIEYVIEKWMKEQSLKVWCPYPRAKNQITPQNAP
ncbi:DUF2806 domain-containing protein [soil metagenome]